MRFLLTTALAGSVFLFSTSDAEARRGGATSEDLVFVQLTELDGPSSTPLSLCMLVERTSALFIPFFTSAQSYVLADNGCETNSYIPLDAQQFAELQNANVIAADLPAEPALSITQKIAGSWGLLGGLGVLGWVGLQAMKVSGRKKQRQAAMGDVSEGVVAILDVMCHVAKADGDTDPGEVQMIIQVASQVTGTEFTEAQVTQMISLSETKVDQHGFKDMARKLSPEGRRLALRGALMVAGADGSIGQAEQTFIGGFASACGIGPEELNATVGQIFGAPQGSPA